MNDHEREVALVAGIACCDSLVEHVRDCIAGAMEGVEDTRREARRDHDADMAAWNAGFAAGLLASKMFVKMAAEHGESLRAAYRELKGMDCADGN
jgi:2-keto-4-pentenoate hydratase/2-oxohepta-3-ene-1,7-dioic acid hydratase in catechol pathway